MNPGLPGIQRGSATIFITEFQLFCRERFPSFRIIRIQSENPLTQLHDGRSIGGLFRCRQLLPQDRQIWFRGRQKNGSRPQQSRYDQRDRGEAGKSSSGPPLERAVQDS
jgi:hypothetical protein